MFEPNTSPDALHEIGDRLLEHGKDVGPFLPWHHSADPYHWLVAEALLRRTTRTAAHKAFVSLIEAYPGWTALLAAPPEGIAERIAWVGLGNQRSRQLKALAKKIMEELDGVVPCTRDALLALPGVGLYVADAVMLYSCGREAFPIDANVKRVVRRVIGLPTPIGTRHSEPYRDPWLRRVVTHFLAVYEVSQLVDIHRGILHIAWVACKPRPNHSLCPLRQVCTYVRSVGAL